MSDERPPSPDGKPMTKSTPPPESSRQALDIDDIMPESQPVPAAAPAPVAEARGSRRSERIRAAKERKSRAKMTMRIPDDEVARPTTAVPRAPDSITQLNIEPVSSPPAVDAEKAKPADGAAPEEPDSEDDIPRISSTGDGWSDPSSPDATMPMAALGSNVVLPDDEDSWTPFQPTAVDNAERDQQDLERVRSTLISSPAVDIFIDDEPPLAPADGPDLRKTLLMDGAFDLPDASSDPDAVTYVDTGSGGAVLTPRSLPMPDAEEIAPEDLVAVDSKPGIRVPSNPPPPPVPKVGRVSTNTPAPPAPILPVASPVTPPAAVPVVAAAVAPVVAPVAPAPPKEPVAPAAPAPPLARLSPVPAPAAAPEGSGIRMAPKAKTPDPPAVAERHTVPNPSFLAPPAMSEAAAGRKRTRPWWEELFNDDFIRASEKVTDAQIARDVDFIEDSLAVVAGATVLDLACGTGRHAIEFVRRGYQVVGFDLSLAMLARAADEAEERNLTLNFVQGDMREMTFEETFDGIYCWNTSFGYFEEEKNAHVISKVHRALKKGGQFLLDVVNRDWVMGHSPSLVWFEGDGCICMDEMQVDAITSRMRVKRTMMMDDGRTKEIDYSIRLYALHELGRLLHEHGFRVAEVSGRIATPGVFFGADSPRTLILAEKR